MTAPVIRIENLSIALPKGGEREFAARDISLELHPGKILCVVGESGSGKSMAANAMMGLLPEGVKAAGGRIMLGDIDLLSQTEVEMRSIRGRDIAMIFQEPMSALNPLMRVGDQIAEVFEAHDLLTSGERRAEALRLLTEVGLPDPSRAMISYPFQLSGGQRQRVMIAMALALEPKVLIADEPTTALDVTTQAQILRLIRRLQEERSMAVMFITHDFGVVAEIADDVAVMQLGEIVERGRADKLLVQPTHAYTRKLLAAIPKMSSQAETRTKARLPLMKVDGLSKTYFLGGGIFREPRQVHAVKDVSLVLGRGETLGIVGESGSGKTSLGRCLVRLQNPTSGIILLDGQDMAKLKGEQLRLSRRRVQMIFQDPYASLNPRLRVGQIVADGPIAFGEDPKRAWDVAVELLQQVGLSPDAAKRFPHEFSGGQRQRVGIARALALRPDVIVADEPVSALDVSIQAQILDLLAELKSSLDLSLIFITHDLRVAAQICDRVMVMHKGEVVESGTTAQLFGSPTHAYTRNLITAIPGKDHAMMTGQAA